MSDIFATFAAATSRPTGTAAGEAAVRVVDPSPDLARLTTGESLRGTVVGKDDRGHLLVRTQLGILNLAAVRSLPVGTEVVLQVRSVGPQVMMNLLPLDHAGGTAPQGTPQGLPPVQAPLPSAGAPAQPALPPNPHDLVQRGQLLRGVLHAAPPMPALAGLPTAQPGTELIVRILSLGVQSAAALAGGAQPGGVQPGGAQPGGTPPGGVLPGSPLPGGAQPGGAQPGAPLQAGPALAATGVATGAAAGTIPPGAPAPAAGADATGAPLPGAATIPAAAGQPAPAPGNPATGGVPEALPGLRLAPQTAVGSSGHSVATALQGLSTEAAAKAAGSPAVAAPAAAPGSAPGSAPGGALGTPGSTAGTLRLTGLVTAATSSGQPILHTPLGTVTLDTGAALPPGTSLALEVALPASGTPAAPGFAAAWPSLEHLEETLLHGLPAAQAELVARALPQVGPRLASGVLFFLSALNQGSIAGWLAQAGAAAEQADRGDLYERLGREFAGLSRSIETPAGEWRFINLPLWSEQGLRELRCFFRHQGNGGGKPGGDGDKATRFVLELELQRHGELQLDGLVRPQRFDMVLRSRRPLPALVRGDLMALFEETNAIAGYNGRLAFQASTDWMQLLAARSKNEPHEGLRV